MTEAMILRSACPTIFLLSPASMSGKRAGLLFNPSSQSTLAHRLQNGEEFPLGELFEFISGLYFRGKLTYAKKFARPPYGIAGIQIITSDRGLISASHLFTLDDLRAMSLGSIEGDNFEYRQPLLNSCLRLATQIGRECNVVLLGSIATAKYVDILLECFGSQLLFPQEFVGRGDLSRGGLLLRSASSELELTYCPVAGAHRKGTRPPKLLPRSNDAARNLVPEG